MIFFVLLLLTCLLLIFERYGSLYFTQPRVFLNLCLGLNLFFNFLVIILLFEFSLYSVMTSLSLVPFTIFSLWQVLRLLHAQWPSRLAAWVFVFVLFGMTWWGTSNLHLQVRNTMLLEFLFQFHVVTPFQSIDPAAYRVLEV